MGQQPPTDGRCGRQSYRRRFTQSSLIKSKPTTERHGDTEKTWESVNAMPQIYAEFADQTKTGHRETPRHRGKPGDQFRAICKKWGKSGNGGAIECYSGRPPLDLAGGSNSRGGGVGEGEKSAGGWGQDA